MKLKKYQYVFVFMVLWCGFSIATANENKSITTNKASKSCSILGRSIVAFKAIIADVEHNYGKYAGEISEILSPATNIYRVSVLQEERIDQFIYELKVNDNCEAEIIDRKRNALDPTTM